jgi:hypothetical protein
MANGGASAAALYATLEGNGGWVQMVDDAWGTPYYYNTITFQTRWDKPPEYNEPTVSAHTT